MAGLGGNAILLAGAGFLAKKWVGVRLAESVRHEYARKLKDIVDEREADTRLFEELQRTLPANGSIAYIKQWDVGAFAFSRSELDQLWGFDRAWGDVAHEFLDGQIEARRQRLHKAVSDYLVAAMANFYTMDGSTELIGVPQDWDVGEEDDQFHVAMRGLNSLADAAWDAYEDLIRTARGRLKC